MLIQERIKSGRHLQFKTENIEFHLISAPIHLFIIYTQTKMNTDPTKLIGYVQMAHSHVFWINQEANKVDIVSSLFCMTLLNFHPNHLATLSLLNFTVETCFISKYFFYVDEMHRNTNQELFRIQPGTKGICLRFLKNFVKDGKFCSYKNIIKDYLYDFMNTTDISINDVLQFPTSRGGIEFQLFQLQEM